MAADSHSDLIDNELFTDLRYLTALVSVVFEACDSIVKSESRESIEYRLSLTNLGHVLVKTKYLMLASASSNIAAVNSSGISPQYCTLSRMSSTMLGFSTDPADEGVDG